MNSNGNAQEQYFGCSANQNQNNSGADQSQNNNDDGQSLTDEEKQPSTVYMGESPNKLNQPLISIGVGEESSYGRYAYVDAKENKLYYYCQRISKNDFSFFHDNQDCHSIKVSHWLVEACSLFVALSNSAGIAAMVYFTSLNLMLSHGLTLLWLADFLVLMVSIGTLLAFLGLYLDDVRIMFVNVFDFFTGDRFISKVDFDFFAFQKEKIEEFTKKNTYTDRQLQQSIKTSIENYLAQHSQVQSEKERIKRERIICLQTICFNYLEISIHEGSENNTADNAQISDGVEAPHHQTGLRSLVSVAGQGLGFICAVANGSLGLLGMGSLFGLFYEFQGYPMLGSISSIHLVLILIPSVSAFACSCALTKKKIKELGLSFHDGCKEVLDEGWDKWKQGEKSYFFIALSISFTGSFATGITAFFAGKALMGVTLLTAYKFLFHTPLPHVAWVSQATLALGWICFLTTLLGSLAISIKVIENKLKIYTEVFKNKGKLGVIRCFLNIEPSITNGLEDRPQVKLSLGFARISSYFLTSLVLISQAVTVTYFVIEHFHIGLGLGVLAGLATTLIFLPILAKGITYLVENFLLNATKIGITLPNIETNTAECLCAELELENFLENKRIRETEKVNGSNKGADTNWSSGNNF